MVRPDANQPMNASSLKQPTPYHRIPNIELKWNDSHGERVSRSTESMHGSQAPVWDHEQFTSDGGRVPHVLRVPTPSGQAPSSHSTRVAIPAEGLKTDVQKQATTDPITQWAFYFYMTAVLSAVIYFVIALVAL